MAEAELVVDVFDVNEADAQALALPVGRKPCEAFHQSVVRPRADIESCIEAAVRVEPRNIVAGRAVVGCKLAADENSAIRLNRNCPHCAVCACADIEGRVKRAVRVQPRDTVSRCAVESSEEAADKNATV